jgi:hypothetical protein
MSNPAGVLQSARITDAPERTDPNKKSAPPQIYNYSAAREARRKEQAQQEQYERQSPKNLERESSIAQFSKDADIES